MKTLRFVAIIILLFLGITATIGGYSLISDPTGAEIQLPEFWIKQTIFNNYLIPGYVLLIMNGLFGFIAAIISILKWHKYAVIIQLQGLVVTGWIVIQILVIQHPFWLQYVFLGIGIFLILAGTILRSDQKS